MNAIITKYLSPTATKGSRIRASDSDGNKIIVPLEYGCSVAEAHLGAAYALCAKMNWLGYLAQGMVKAGFAHVFVTEAPKALEALCEIDKRLTLDAVEMSQRGRTQSVLVQTCRCIAHCAKEGL